MRTILATALLCTALTGVAAAQTAAPAMKATPMAKKMMMKATPAPKKMMMKATPMPKKMTASPSAMKPSNVKPPASNPSP
jgi:hypothetical protein